MFYYIPINGSWYENINWALTYVVQTLFVIIRDNVLVSINGKNMYSAFVGSASDKSLGFGLRDREDIGKEKEERENLWWNLSGTASEFIRKTQMDDETILRKKCQILSCFFSLQNNQRRQLVYKLNFNKRNYENMIRFWGFVIIN